VTEHAIRNPQRRLALRDVATIGAQGTALEPQLRTHRQGRGIVRTAVHTFSRRQPLGEQGAGAVTPGEGIGAERGVAESNGHDGCSPPAAAAFTAKHIRRSTYASTC
jgi:hypothetical protein